MKSRHAATLAILLGLLILLLPLTLLAKTALRPLSSYNWAANASPNLATKPPPKAAVRRLMEQLEPDSGEANGQTRICSFRFVDLGHAGNLTLLVSRYDGGGADAGTFISSIARLAVSSSTTCGPPFTATTTLMMCSVISTARLTLLSATIGFGDTAPRVIRGSTAGTGATTPTRATSRALGRFMSTKLKCSRREAAMLILSASREASQRFSGIFLVRRRIPVSTTRLD